MDVAALTDEEKEDRLKQVRELMDMLRPVVLSDGGDLRLKSVDPETGVVEVRLSGSCSSCAISSDTLQEGVQRILKERLDWVTEVIGEIDESLDWAESASMGRGNYVPRW